MKLLALWLVVVFGVAVATAEPVKPFKTAVAKRPFLLAGKAAANVSAKADHTTSHAVQARDIHRSNRGVVRAR